VKAVVVHGKGDLRVEEIEDAVCGSNNVLVEMEWGGICCSDVAYWQKGGSPAPRFSRIRWFSGTRSPGMWPHRGGRCRATRGARG
jgi:threonine dehydrogenase-like Zn-dependent dehydrogenase